MKYSWWHLVKFIFRWTKNQCVSCAFPFTLIKINCRLFDDHGNEERAKQGIIASARLFELLSERGTSAFVSWLSPHLKTRGQEWTEGLMHFVSVKPTFSYPPLSQFNSLSFSWSGIWMGWQLCLNFVHQVQKFIRMAGYTEQLIWDLLNTRLGVGESSEIVY